MPSSVKKVLFKTLKRALWKYVGVYRTIRVSDFGIGLFENGHFCELESGLHLLLFLLIYADDRYKRDVARFMIFYPPKSWI
jgi:hypothetical protein